MPEEVSAIDIIELAETLENRKSNSQRIAIIIGSRAGALFHSADFYEELKAYSTRNLADMDERTRFRECHSILEDIHRRKTMSIKELRSFIEGEIDAHFDVEELLAQMVKDDFFKVIITNNIDDIVYESFKAVGMRERIDFVDFSLGRLSCADNVELILSQKKINIRRLIKMAGDIDTFIGNLNRPQAKKALGECVRHLLDQLRIREVLIVGIDLAWDQPVLSALSSHLETIWFVNEDDDIKDKFLESCANIKNFRYLTGAKGNYKYFFRLLYWYINQSSTESHTLIEEVKSSMHNMRIDLNHLKRRVDEINADNTKSLKLLHSKMDSIMRFLEDTFENKKIEGE